MNSHFVGLGTLLVLCSFWRRSLLFNLMCGLSLSGYYSTEFVGDATTISSIDPFYRIYNLPDNDLNFLLIITA